MHICPRNGKENGLRRKAIFFLTTRNPVFIGLHQINLFLLVDLILLSRASPHPAFPTRSIQRASSVSQEIYKCQEVTM